MQGGNVRALACVLLAACGRVGFDPTTSSSVDASESGAALSYSSDDVNAVLDITSVSLVPTSTGTHTYSVAPALPSGLALDPDTGVISGIPTAVADAVNFTVSARTPSGALATASFVLTVLPGWVVDTTAEGMDDDAGVDARCFSTVAGGCSLRAALKSANQRPAKQLILLDAATYRMSSSLDPVGTDLVIAGRGVALTHVQPATAHPGFGFLRLLASHDLGLKQVSVDDYGSIDGAALNIGAGTAQIDACAFSRNVSNGSGGVLFAHDGAQVTIRRSTFTANVSYGGCCSGWGGVIDGEGAGTTIVVEQSTATRNESAWGSFAHITTGTTLRLENSTLYDNLSTIAGTLATPGGTYTLVNDTIVNNRNTNSTPESAGLYLYSAPCHYTVANTIVAFNTDVNGAPYDCDRRDLSTSLTSNGGNVFGDDAHNCAAYFIATGDRLMTDPQLVPGGPGPHGGATETILPTSTSTVLGAGRSCPAIDQRGVPRDLAICDVGAVELP
ncbi:MAG: putative Ig domain-containing protein [Myxococcales bacterium]|nr:putative Ig domain-containing protein [Myxococcales bacterium]